MLTMILIAVCAIGLVVLNILLAVHMAHMKKAFAEVKALVITLSKLN